MFLLAPVRPRLAPGAPWRRCLPLALLLLLLALPPSALPCGPGRGYGQRRGPRKTTPLVYKQHVPNVSEQSLGASGLPEGQITRADPRMNELVVNNNPEVLFKDEEGTGADRIMSQRCKDKVTQLALLVLAQWPGVRLRVTEAWDEDGHHATESLHYEGRAVDVTTSDRDRSKYGMLARLAVEAGFDWVYYESRGHVHCSVKSDSSIAIRTGGCFPGDSTVQLESGERTRLADLSPPARVLALDSTGAPVYSDLVAFLHRDPALPASFTELTTEGGQTVTLTADHLIYTTRDPPGGTQGGPRGGPRGATGDDSWGGPLEAEFAGVLAPGSYVYVAQNVSSAPRVLAVTRVRKVFARGVYAPLTSHGSVVVDDVVTSCYAALRSERLAHAATAPLRMLAGWVKGCGGEGGEVGVHWYAAALEGVARYLLPSSLWYT